MLTTLITVGIIAAIILLFAAAIYGIAIIFWFTLKLTVILLLICVCLGAIAGAFKFIKKVLDETFCKK